MHAEVNEKPRVTWIEVAIIAVVLAMVAALVVPRFSEAGTDPRARELRSAVQIVQGQIEMYRLQHDNRYPTLEQFVQQMTQPTDVRGQVAVSPAGGPEFGPYLRRIPDNPYTGTNEIAGRPGGAAAWRYNESTGEFRPNRPEPGEL